MDSEVCTLLSYSCQHLCHADVVGFGRNGWENLEGEGDGDEGTGEVGKKAVVVTFTASEAVALEGECHAGDDGEVDLSIGIEEGTLRLLDAERGADGEGGFSFVAMEREGVACDGGQEDGFSCGKKDADEVMGADFIGQGMVEEDGMDAILLLDAFKQ